MPETKEQKLRLYCICGQKMKVAESMYGLPGKCIACRQKIRLPKEEEIPEGVFEIYLKDHPELLRTPPNKNLEEETNKALEALKSAKPLLKGGADDEPTPITELDIPDASNARKENYEGAVPLDPLESLQRLTSLQWKLERKLDKIRSTEPVDKTLKAETKGRLSKLKHVRNDFDEQLRQRLMEAAIELTTTQEKIAQIQVSVRVSEISYEAYHEQVVRLRGRRDRMERRQQNLQGWIATADPFAIGGYISMDVDAMPEDGYRLLVPSEAEATEGLLQAYTSGLKRSMRDRSLAEHKLDEAKKIRDESGDTLSHQTVASARGERNRSRGNVGFFQSRLKQLKKDMTGDVETAAAQLDNARSLLSMGEINRSDFDKIESSIKRVRLDNAKALSLVERALSANASGDIPHMRGTFLERLTTKNSGLAHLSIPLAWAAALLYVLSLFVPIAGGESLMRSFLDYYAYGSSGIWWIVMPLLAGIGVGFGSMVPQQVVRGGLLLAIGAVTYVLLVYVVHESRYSLDQMATRFRTGGDWFLRPGMIAMLAATIGVIVSAGLDLWSERNGRIALACAVLIGLGAESVIVTNVFGSRLPNPEVDFSKGPHKDSRTEFEVAVIRVINNGSRELHLVHRESDARNAYRISLEKKIGSDSFIDAVPKRLNGSDSVMSGGLASVSVGPNDRYIEKIPLPPGEYRIALATKDGASRKKLFTIEERVTDETLAETVVVDPTSPDAPVAEVNEEPGIEAAEREIPPAIPQEDLSQVLLKGILQSADGSPRFSIVFTKDGKERKFTLGLGEPFVGGWNVTEYNPGQRAITLQREGELMIVRRGEVYLIQD